MDVITSGNIQFDSKLKLKYITALKLMIEAQKHGVCIVEGVLENGEEAQEILTSERDISAGIRNTENGEILFRGIIKEAKISCEDSLWHIMLRLLTVSERLDRNQNQRSFQNKAMTYEAAVGRVMEPYENLAVVYMEGTEETLKKPMIQYGETDWEFLLRLGSRLHIPLYAEHLTGGTSFYFGMRKGRNIDIDTDACHMGISQRYYIVDSRESGLIRRDYRYYVIVSDENYQIGDMLRFKIGSGRIFRKSAELVHECLVYTYWAGGCGNWYIPEMEHSQLVGMEFAGSVVDTRSEKIRINLMIDEPYKGADHEWNWEPVSGNIMYAMPEKGSIVRLSFGSEEAAEGVGVSNPRGSEPIMPDQQERTFITMAGKRMELYPENLSFKTRSGETSIMDGKGINMTSMSRMEMTAHGTVSFHASKIHVQTPLEINMYKSDSYCREKEREIGAKGTRSNPPTGNEDSGFTMNFEFNALSQTSVLCGSDFIKYCPFPDAPNELIIEEFSMEKLLDRIKEGAIVILAVTGTVVYLASIVASGGATLSLAPWIIGGCTFLTGGALVGSLAVEDYKNQEVSSGAAYVAKALQGTGKGAKAGISFCMAPYASHLIVSEVLPPGMVGVTINHTFISRELLTSLATKVGQVLTVSNIIMLENDSAEGILGTNVLQNALGETRYTVVRDASKFASDEILEWGLYDIAGYGINRGEVVDEGGTGLDDDLLDELANSGVKYNSQDVVAVTKTADGKLVWLENGTENAGLNHIIGEHADDFLNQGISQEQIPNYVMEALKNGEIVGYQGRGTSRPIYEFIFNGEMHRVAITVGDNGFIVGANPK